MTDSPDEYGELLRRALSAEANSVVPSPDGLEIIRARIERRGLRGLMWWRAGASVAGAVLVAATVVMVVPQFRQHVADQIQSGEVNFTVPTKPEMSATSRPPVRVGTPPPAPARPSVTPPAPLPATSRPGTPSPKPSAKPSRTPKPTPSPSCPTAPANSNTVEPEGLPKGCGESETPAPPLPSDTGSSDSPCALDECPPGDGPRTPMPTEVSGPTPTGGR